MCGRLGYSPPPGKLSSHFSLADLHALPPNADVRPGTFIPVVGWNPHRQARGVASIKWGFVPDWAPDPNKGKRPINAMAEHLHWDFWRGPFQTKRAIVPADSWYEWPGKKRTIIYRRDAELMGFAAVWSVWGEGKDRLLSGAIITTGPAGWFRPVHDRMPAILRPEDYTAWLDPRTPTDALKAMLRPWEGDDFAYRQVSGPEFVRAAA
jgi:putative SOS response-associated peptidase YedK